MYGATINIPNYVVIIVFAFAVSQKNGPIFLFAIITHYMKLNSKK